jgi:hypothetical protein
MGSKETENYSPGPTPVAHPDRCTDENKPEVPSTPDRVKINNDTTTYTNSGHWTSILDGVSWADITICQAAKPLPIFLHASEPNQLEVLLHLVPKHVC